MDGFVGNAPLQEIKNDLLKEKDVTLYIKREDLLHPSISGNKWRKLKYNIQEAQFKGAETMLTFGGAYSNHIAAVAAAGKEFGFATVGIIRGEEHLPLNPTLSFAKECGMLLHYVSREEYGDKEDHYYLDYLRKEFKADYILPEGGTNYLAVNGCMEIVKDIDIPFDWICTACGTGGTAAGLVLSVKEKQQVLGFPALKGGEFLQKDIAFWVNEMLNDKDSTDEFMESFQLNTDYHFGGYAKVDSSLIEFINTFYREHSIKLDPIYTGKMMFGLFDLIEKDFFAKGASIIALHTGGLQGLKGMEERLKVQFFEE